MKRVAVKSSNVRSVGYDSEKRELEVEFHSGWVYVYFDVPAAMHKSFIESKSLGKFLHSNIVPAYRAEPRMTIVLPKGK